MAAPRRIALLLTLALAGLVLIGLTSAPRTAAAATPPTTTSPSTATVAGTLIQSGGASLPGMLVQAAPVGVPDCTAATGCASTYTGPRGAWSLTGLATGTYTLQVIDGARTVTLAQVALTAGQAAGPVALVLGAAQVPPGTVARASGRDLRWLNAERARAGLPGRVVLNPRWSQECAAHDDYEAANGVLQSAEDPTADGASAGGAWAGLNSDLAEGRWTPAATPWENAPIHLLALLAPSLSVTGIDDSGTLQCAVTFPGMLRRWTGPDAVTTVPGRGATGVPASELARETPFTPVQFVGLPTGRTTGRELFVYLNRSAQVGQAPVRIVSAGLSRAGHAVAVRWVDSATRTIGPYLAGGIVIPLRPLRPATRYHARVVVQDGSTTLMHAWTFTTR